VEEDFKMKCDIKTKKIDKLTSNCTYVYENGSTFSCRISNQFDPSEIFKYDHEYFKKLMTSNLKTSTKLIAMFLPTIRLGNSPICIKPAYSIAHMLHISYNTVRSGMKELMNFGIVEEGKYIYNGNIVKQYRINNYDKWRIPLGREDDDVHDGEEICESDMQVEEVYCDDICSSHYENYGPDYVSPEELML
jgi:hypothetical protein